MEKISTKTLVLTAAGILAVGVGVALCYISKKEPINEKHSTNKVKEMIAELDK